MERGLARQPTMEQRALARLSTKERLNTLGYSLDDVQSLGRMMSSRHWAQPDEFDEANRKDALNSHAMKKQLSLASIAANNPKADPLLNAWEDRRRSNDAGLAEMRKQVGGAREASTRGTGHYSEQKYKMSGCVFKVQLRNIRGGGRGRGRRRPSYRICGPRACAPEVFHLPYYADC